MHEIEEISSAPISKGPGRYSMLGLAGRAVGLSPGAPLLCHAADLGNNDQAGFSQADLLCGGARALCEQRARKRGCPDSSPQCPQHHLFRDKAGGDAI